MKVLLLLSLSFFVLPVFACPDFSGQYIRFSDGLDLTIYQDQCELISYVVNDHKYVYEVDNREHLVGQYNIEGDEEGSIIATVKIYQKRFFKDEDLMTEGRSETFYVDTQQLTVNKSFSRSYYDADRNITVESVSEDGTFSEDTFLRVK